MFPTILCLFDVGDLSFFAPARRGRLTSTPLKSTTAMHDYDCAKLCRDMGDGCISFDYDYSYESSKCNLHWTIEGIASELVESGSYHNFEKLGAGYTAYFDFDGLTLLHGVSYYLNARITNIRGFESYISSHEVVVDFTPPLPGTATQL